MLSESLVNQVQYNLIDTKFEMFSEFGFQIILNIFNLLHWV